MALQEALDTQVFGGTEGIELGVNASALGTGLVFVIGAAIAFQIGKNFMKSD